jgi:hypothetical protein
VLDAADAARRLVLTRALDACTKMPKTGVVNCTLYIPPGNNATQKDTGLVLVE